MNTLVTDFLAKLDEVKTICEDITTTSIQLDTKIDELAVIETDITTAISTESMSHFTSILHLDNFLKCRNEMLNRTLLQCHVMNLIKIKQDEYKNKILNSETEENLLLYETELIEIKHYYKDNIISLVPIQNFKMKSICAVCN